jgi:predicted Zn-dependent protease with MMP-like domain
MEIVEGWALPDEFTRDNVITLLKNYPRAFDSIGLAYTKELMGIREKTEAGRRSDVYAGTDACGAERFWFNA